MPPTVFQYQQVQLRDATLTSILPSQIIFQYQQVQLRGHAQAPRSHLAESFQYQQVQLRGEQRIRIVALLSAFNTSRCN